MMVRSLSADRSGDDSYLRAAGGAPDFDDTDDYCSVKSDLFQSSLLKNREIEV